MENKPLYILTYDHGGFVLWGNEVKPRLKKLLQWMEKYPKLKIGLDYESYTFDEYSMTDPEIIDLISQLITKYPSRVGLGATTYGQPLSLFVSEESNVRQLTYAIRTNLKYFGQTPNVYSISEFALNNQTPQLARLCGYDAAILRSHVMGYGYVKNFDIPWGNWVGKDNTQIPAVPTYDKQGRGFNCTTLDNWILSRWPKDHAYYAPEDFEKTFEHISPLLASRYDDLTQPIEDLTSYVETKENYHYVLLEDIPALYGEANEEMRTTDNDFHVQMPWGYCGNEIFNGCRASEVSAAQAEKLNALSVILGGESMQEKLEDSWRYALVAQHHDVTICGLLDLSRRFIPDSLKLSAQVKEDSLKSIKSHFSDCENESVIVINPHSFAVNEWIEAEVEGDVVAFDGDKALECEKNGNTLRVNVELLPLSVKRLTLRNLEIQTKSAYTWNKESGILNTPLYELRLNDNGICYIDDVIGNRRIFDNGNGELFTAYVDGESCVSHGKWEVNITSHGAVAVQYGTVGTIPYRFEMKFSGKQQRIDCKAKFEMHNEKVGHSGVDEGLKKSLTVDGHRHEEKMCFIMNMCLDNDRRMVRDLPFSISDWNGAVRDNEEYWYPDDLIRYDKDVTPEESFAGTTYMQGVYWLCMRDQKQGLAVFNRGCMGSVVQGNRLSVPLLYSDLYMCGTRILEGEFENEFALFPFDSALSDADLHRNAFVYAYQPVVETVEKGNGDMDEFKIADFNAVGGDVIMTAMYSEDGAIFARFCNYSDEPSAATFETSIGNVTHETDLLGKELSEICENKLCFRPWEIKTIKIVL